MNRVSPGHRCSFPTFPVPFKEGKNVGMRLHFQGRESGLECDIEYRLRVPSERFLTKEVEFYFINNGGKPLRILKKSYIDLYFRKITPITVWCMALWRETNKNIANNLAMSR